MLIFSYAYLLPTFRTAAVAYLQLMDKQLLKSKFPGALVGTGLGDSLGAPFEGSPIVSPEEIEKAADKQELLTYTDDTHMMIGEKNWKTERI